MARNRMTTTDYLARTEEPVDELWHQQLILEIEQALDELEAEIGREQPNDA